MEHPQYFLWIFQFKSLPVNEVMNAIGHQIFIYAKEPTPLYAGLNSINNIPGIMKNEINVCTYINTQSATIDKIMTKCR